MQVSLVDPWVDLALVLSHDVHSLRSKLLLSYQKLISMWKDLETLRNGVCYHRKMKKLWLLVLLNESNLSSGCFNP